jgi:hypothetical protein
MKVAMHVRSSHEQRHVHLLKTLYLLTLRSFQIVNHRSPPEFEICVVRLDRLPNVPVLQS